MSEPRLATGSQDQFDRLQKKLVPLWKSIERFNQDPQTIVVVPSMSIDAISAGAVMQAYEERFLFLLLLLRQPRARLIYVTSEAILPSIIDYYLDLLPGVIPSHARPRLFLPSPLDGSISPLSQKLLERPRLIERIRSLIPDPDRAHLVPFNTTNREKEFPLGNQERVPENLPGRECPSSSGPRESRQQRRRDRGHQGNACPKAFNQASSDKA